MIEALTSQVLMTTMFLIIVAAPVLTLLLSVLLLWRYRRTVETAMRVSSGFQAADTDRILAQRTGDAASAPQATSINGEQLFQRVIRAPSIENFPEYRFGAIALPARSSVTPAGMVKLWLVVNGGPTLLILLCLNRRVRAVAPLMLGLVTATIAGALATMLLLFSTRGVNVAVIASMSLDLQVYWLVLAVLLVSLAAFGAIGWMLARWIACAYQRGQLSDQSLMLDALWLLFASSYSMWLLRGELMWVMTAPIAFLAFKLTWALLSRLEMDRKSAPVDLTFLRVFSLGLCVTLGIQHHRVFSLGGWIDESAPPVVRGLP